MANEYVKLWDSYADYFEPLSDAEVGRLVLGMLQYKSTGTAPEFSGNERFVWPAIRRDIDEAIRKHDEFLEKQAENGKKGGRPPKAQAFSEKPTETQKTQAFSEKPKKAKDKGHRTKEKEMDKDSVAAVAATTARAGARDTAAADPCPAVELDPWLAKAVQCYEANIGALPRYVAERLESWLAELGPDLVCEAIHRAASANARNWNYAEKILQSWQDSGVRTVEAARMEQNTRQRTPRTQAAQQAQTADEVWRRIAEGGDSDDRSGGSRFAAIDGEVLAELPSGR